MVELYKNIVCVSVTELVEFDIITESNLKKSIIRGKIQRVRRACYGTTAAISYDSLPERYQQQIKKHLKVDNILDAIKTNIIENFIRHDAKISDFFENVKLPDGRNLLFDKQREYYNNGRYFCRR